MLVASLTTAGVSPRPRALLSLLLALVPLLLFVGPLSSVAAHGRAPVVVPVTGGGSADAAHSPSPSPSHPGDGGEPPGQAVDPLLQPVGPKCHDHPFNGKPENGFVIPNACCHPKFHVPLRIPKTMPHCFTDSTGKKHYGVTMRQIRQRFGLVNRSAECAGPDVDTEVWAYGPDCTETFEHRIHKVRHRWTQTRREGYPRPAIFNFGHGLSAHLRAASRLLRCPWLLPALHRLSALFVCLSTAGPTAT